jgi:hypothetical protein
MAERALVVTADDFGFGVATSAGIIRAHIDGPVTATSVMVVTGDHVKASVQLLVDAPDLDLGLHLVVTNVGARPLVATRASGLLSRDGRFLSNGQLWTRAWTRRLDPAAVFDEICAQAKMFERLIGHAPSHVDGHHHAHQLPVIRQALMRAMATNVVPPITRLTIEPPGMLAAVRTSPVRRLALHLLGSSAIADFRRQGIKGNDYYIGALAESDLLRPFPWDPFLARLPLSGLIDWMVHPGLPDESLIGRDHYVEQRVRELEALTSPALRSHWGTLRLGCWRRAAGRVSTASRVGRLIEREHRD